MAVWIYPFSNKRIGESLQVHPKVRDLRRPLEILANQVLVKARVVHRDIVILEQCGTLSSSEGKLQFYAIQRRSRRLCASNICCLWKDYRRPTYG